MKTDALYRISFLQGEVVCELYARYISEDSLMGFVEVEELVFSDNRNGIVIDANEEKLKQQFKGVNSTYLPMHTILRIDVVEQQVRSAIKAKNNSETNVARLPSVGTNEQHE